MQKHQLIKHNFNKAAASYDDSCNLQVSVGKQLITQIRNGRFNTDRILDVGCGTGIVTKLLAQTLRHSELYATDNAQQMLHQARKHLADTLVYFSEHDFDQPYTHPILFDLIFSNMALQWSTNIQTTLTRFASQLNAHGRLAFSIPLPGTLKELAPRFSLHHFYPADELTTYLQNAGLATSFHHEKIILAFPDTLSALRSIKQVGANFAADRHHHGLRGKGFIGNTAPQILTYEIGYFIASKST